MQSCVGASWAYCAPVITILLPCGGLSSANG